jgi:hypothetical protein
LNSDYIYKVNTIEFDENGIWRIGEKEESRMT